MTNRITRRSLLGALATASVPALAMNVEDYLRLGLDKSFLDRGLDAEVNGRHNNEALEALDVPGDRQYHPCPEADPGPDVPRGTVREFLHWDRTRIYEGTVRDVWVYVPEQLEYTTAPSLMVFLDGDLYLAANGPVRATAVLDSLIHAGGTAADGRGVRHAGPARGDDRGRSHDQSQHGVRQRDAYARPVPRRRNSCRSRSRRSACGSRRIRRGA